MTRPLDAANASAGLTMLVMKVSAVAAVSAATRIRVVAMSCMIGFLLVRTASSRGQVPDVGATNARSAKGGSEELLRAHTRRGIGEPMMTVTYSPTVRLLAEQCASVRSCHRTADARKRPFLRLQRVACRLRAAVLKALIRTSAFPAARREWRNSWALPLRKSTGGPTATPIPTFRLPQLEQVLGRHDLQTAFQSIDFDIYVSSPITSMSSRILGNTVMTLGF